MKESNKGVTLIELLVVITIMGILIGISTLSYSVVHSANVTETGKKVITLLNETRASQMSRRASNGWSLTLYKNGEGVVCADIIRDDASTPERITTTFQTLDMFYSEDGGNNFFAIEDFSISYVTETGGVRSITVNGENGTSVFTSGTGVIKFVKGTRDVSVAIYFATGKCE